MLTMTATSCQLVCFLHACMYLLFWMLLIFLFQYTLLQFYRYFLDAQQTGQKPNYCVRNDHLQVDDASTAIFASAAAYWQRQE